MEKGDQKKAVYNIEPEDILKWLPTFHVFSCLLKHPRSAFNV